MRAILLALLLTSGCLLGLSNSAAANSCVSVGLDGVSAECVWTYADYSEASSSGDGHTWVVTIQCGNGGICAEHVECLENGEEGFVHDVYMDGTDVGDVCVPASEVEEVNIAELAIREFKRLSWPSSDLVVQPPGGKTLVNFETNFFTTNNQISTRTVTLAGRSVEIRAMPSYTFNFGDGVSLPTTNPGRPHPNLDVTHTYLRKGDVVVSVDTTYAGEFRIGDGDWQAIPDTLTVAGAGSDLEIVEAIPQLVIR